MHKVADVAIIGGGLAGLAAAIKMADAGYEVILIEKERYPFHKVCGEYISMESWDFICSLGLPLGEYNLPLLNQLLLTAPNGKRFSADLPLGGFGISRFKLDHALAEVARKKGVVLLEETKAEEVIYKEHFTIKTTSRNAAASSIQAKLCCAAFGKKSNLDVKWNRPFLNKQDKRLDNFIGIKYHIHFNGVPNEIALHNFEKGYCGISQVEEGKYCLCYLTTASQLKSCGNSISELEKTVLSVNPNLREILQGKKVVEGFPVSISQISFQKKEPVKDHMLFLGDAAGMITPLCGNGMSIALHTAKIASELMKDYLQGRHDRAFMEQEYGRQWNRHFSKRLSTGRMLQKFFGSNRLSNGLVQALNTFPFLARPIIKMTHGQPF